MQYRLNCISLIDIVLLGEFYQLTILELIWISPNPILSLRIFDEFGVMTCMVLIISITLVHSMITSFKYDYTSARMDFGVTCVRRRIQPKLE